MNTWRYCHEKLLNLNYPFFQKLANQKLDRDFYQLSPVLTPWKVSSYGSGNTYGCSPGQERFPVKEIRKGTWQGELYSSNNCFSFFIITFFFFSPVIWQHIVCPNIFLVNNNLSPQCKSDSDLNVLWHKVLGFGAIKVASDYAWSTKLSQVQCRSFSVNMSYGLQP